MFPGGLFEDPRLANAKCSKCGKPYRQEGGKPPPEIAPFITSDIYVEMNPLGFCHSCGKAFCSNCKDSLYCPDCHELLLADPPREGDSVSRSLGANGLVISALRMGAAFALAGFTSALSSIFDIVGPAIVFLMLACVLWPPYFRGKYNGTAAKHEYLMLMVKSLPFCAVIAVVMVPSVANYIGAWGMVWGMTAVFTTNLLYRQLRLGGNIGKWLVVMSLCWLYAFAGDKALRSLWGPSPYDLETVFYGMHAFFGAAAATTIAVTYLAGRRRPVFVAIAFVLIGAGFLAGDILSLIFIKPFLLVFANPFQAAVVCNQTVSALFGGLVAGMCFQRLSSGAGRRQIRPALPCRRAT